MKIYDANIIELGSLSGSFGNNQVNSRFTGSFSGSFFGDATGLTGIVSTSASYASTASYSPQIRSFGITIDGAGSAISTGIKGDLTIPFSGTINNWYILADQIGSIVIDVWKDAFGNYPPTVAESIAGSEKPSLSSEISNSDTNLTTWATTVTAGDVVRFNVDSSSTVTRVNLVIGVVI